MNKEYNIDLKSSNIVDSEDGSKSAAYTFNQENRFSHYQITYNEKEKVSFVSFFVDKNNINDVEAALAFYYYQTRAIAEIIEPNIAY